MASLTLGAACTAPTPLPHNLGIVLARFKEDIEIWAPYAAITRVYDKGDIPPQNDTVDRAAFLSYQKLPNTGREGQTWLDHIVAHYDDLPEYSIFSQADPFDLLGPAGIDNPGQMIEICLSLEPDEDFTPFNEDLFHVTADWAKINWTDPPEALWMTPSQLQSLDVATVTPGEYWKQVLGVPHPPAIKASHGGTYCTRRESIRRWPKAVFETALRAFERANSSNPEIGFFHERMWSPMFDLRNWLNGTEG